MLDDDSAGEPAQPQLAAGLPLTGITVVSVEQAVAAPFATRQLADLGAGNQGRAAGTGDFARDYDATVKGLASYFVWLNRGKQSLSLDIKSAAGHSVLASLIGRADVFIQNLAPGAAAGWACPLRSCGLAMTGSSRATCPGTPWTGRSVTGGPMTS